MPSLARIFEDSRITILTKRNRKRGVTYAGYEMLSFLNYYKGLDSLKKKILDVNCSKSISRPSISYTQTVIPRWSWHLISANSALLADWMKVYEPRHSMRHCLLWRIVFDEDELLDYHILYRTDSHHEVDSLQSTASSLFSSNLWWIISAKDKKSNSLESKTFEYSPSPKIRKKWCRYTFPSLLPVHLKLKSPSPLTNSLNYLRSTHS